MTKQLKRTRLLEYKTPTPNFYNALESKIYFGTAKNQPERTYSPLHIPFKIEVI